MSLMCNFELLVAQQFSLQQISMKYPKNHYANIPKLQGKMFHICICSKMVFVFIFWFDFVKCRVTERYCSWPVGGAGLHTCFTFVISKFFKTCVESMPIRAVR